MSAEISKPVAIPRVIVVAIDNVAHDLAAAALADTLGQIQPIATVTFSNKNIHKNAVWLPLHTQSGAGPNVWAETLWKSVGTWTEPTHILTVQYDGWVLDGARWNPEWLQYDYVGAPWPWYRDRKVGNGGFSLRSTRLMNFLCEHQKEFPLRDGHPEDDLLCRVYRPALEISGFQWAPESVARRFSFEREIPTEPTFGFHGLFNFEWVLGRAKMLERLKLASDYVRSRSEWRELGI